MDFGIKFLSSVFTVYIITVVITSSSLFEPIRKFIIQKTPKLRIGKHPHPIECRLCFGFWATFLYCLCMLDFTFLLPIYGLSYFLATQER